MDQVNWRVYPVLRLLLVGPSGLGKDTAIKPAMDSLRELGHPPVVGGRTFEKIVRDIALMPPIQGCHEVVLPAPEITALIGKQDYKEGIIQGLTDLLSDAEGPVNMGIKSEKDKPSILYKPTITMFAGSTVDWLHKAAPDGALEGGFFPRFLIIPEEYNSRHVPLLKFDMTKAEQLERKRAVARWQNWLHKLRASIAHRRKPREISIEVRAAALYTAWYYNRRKYFADSVRPYAERSRDQVLRLAMIHAIAIDRLYVTPEDIKFGIMVMNYIGQKLASVIIPPAPEAQAASDILSILPADRGRIIASLVRKHGRKRLDQALSNLLDGQEISRNPNTGKYVKIKEA